jgi:V8-like Glu-specific endopeptidase
MPSAVRSALVLALLTASCAPAEPTVNLREAPIVGGTLAPDGYLPAVGALVAYSYGQVMPFCTGTLVSDQLVVSAAHCVKAIGSEIPSGVPIGFFYGQSVYASGASSKILPFASWQAHPSYKGGNPPAALTNWYDIGVLKLAKPTTITPIKLIRPKELGLLKYGTELLIAGYGLTSAKNQGSSGTKYYATTTLAAVGQSELLLGGKGQPQTCSGDSGGPTLVDASGSEDWRLVGVTSRGDQSCLLESVDTRVDSFLSWIHSAGTIPCGSGLSADCETAPTPPTPPQTPPTPPTEPPAPAPTPAPAPAPTPAPTPAKKALGESCAANADCTSGLCAEADGARFCTQLCDPSVGCPASGMVCASAGEELHACAPAAPEAEAFNGDEATGGCTLAARPVAARGLGLLLAALLLGLALLRRSR